MRVTFRIDDVSPYMVWENFHRLVGMMIKHDIRPLLGVIPDNQDPALLRLAHNSGGWDEIRHLHERGFCIAQHGARHVYTTQDPGRLGINAYSEFAGLSYDRQHALLSEGQRILTGLGLQTDIFMAPAHSYDDTTLRALHTLGFRYVTDGYGLFPYMRQGLKFIPCQTSKPLKVPAGLVTVCLHPNTTPPESFDALDRWLARNRRVVCSFDAARDIPARTVLGLGSEKIVLLIRRAARRRAGLHPN
ncbi:DUF2334 domain-containing protein [Oscillospiraceae bacterium WX1]